MKNADPSRLPRLRPSELDAEQAALYEAIAGGARAQGPQHFALVDAEGRLAGPFNAFLYAPPLGMALQEVGSAVRYRTTFSTRLREALILVVAYHWDSDFEIHAHEAVGIAAGLTAAELQALRECGPAFEEGFEAVAVEVCRSLVTGDVDDELWARAVEALGTTALVELTALVGYYAAIALQLRVFRVKVDAAEPTRQPDSEDLH